MRHRKKILLGALICIGVILILVLCSNEHRKSINDGYMSYSFAPDSFEITFTAEKGYAFAGAKAEYGRLSVPGLYEEPEPLKEIVVSLEDTEVDQGEFIYFYILTDGNAENPGLLVHIISYDILLRNEDQLYIGRLRGLAEGGHERLDIYNTETGELLYSE